jgi:hypothetical protein
MLVWYFRQFVHKTKSCHVISGRQEFYFLSCVLAPICSVLKIILKLNRVRLKLSYTIPYFVITYGPYFSTDQTHPK